MPRNVGDVVSDVDLLLSVAAHRGVHVAFLHDNANYVALRAAGSADQPAHPGDAIRQPLR